MLPILCIAYMVSIFYESGKDNSPFCCAGMVTQVFGRYLQICSTIFLLQLWLVLLDLHLFISTSDIYNYYLAEFGWLGLLKATI